MIRSIIGLLCVVLLLIGTVPARAQEVETSWLTEEQLQWGDKLSQKASEATDKGNFALAEKYWTQLIEAFPSNPAAWSNRGISRIGQGKLEAAISDYDRAIALAPDAPDPYLNRGAAYEAQQRYQKAIEDYERVLEIDPADAMAYNNRGNAEAGQERWHEAIADYHKAADLAPNFAFARANEALALYQVGDRDKALRTMRNLVRKYPMFPDMRAALTAVLWEQGNQGEAESNWVAAMGLDSRYQNLEWVEKTRRWPPKMAAALEKFLTLQ